jgi:hypothetical protein
VGCSGGMCGSGARTRPLIKRWAATARASPRGFAINAGAEAHAPSGRSAANARASAPTFMPLRVPASHAAQASASSHIYFTAMRARGVCGRTHVSSGSVRADANLPQIWARDGSGRTCRSSYVAPLERAKPTRLSGRTRSDTRGRDASAHWRCP